MTPELGSRFEISDDELMKRIAQRDVPAFETVYARYRTVTAAHALRVCGHRNLAEEATQDAFLTLWRTADRYHPDRGTLKSWLTSIVRNRSIDLLRRRARHDANVEIDEDLIERLVSAECTEAEVAAREQSGQTRRLLADLPSEQRQVILLAFFKGLSHTEIAARIGIPLGTVKGRQRLGLARMRRALTSPPALAWAGG
jgi:RNA polymerase sigma-70 factor (ECF subfamily)